MICPSVVDAARRLVEDYRQSPTDYPATKAAYLEALASGLEICGEPSMEMARVYEVTGATTQTELASILGITPQAVSHATKTGRVPVSWLVTLAELYNKPISWFRTGK